MIFRRPYPFYANVGLAAVCWLFACTMSSPAEPTSERIRQALAMTPAPHCPEGCSSHLWPRVIVGVIPPRGSDKEGIDFVRVKFRDQQGTVFDGNPHGCPDTPGILCTFSFFSSPADRFVTLQVESIEAGDLASKAIIQLGPFNYCGRDIAYVTVTLAANLPPEIHPPEFVSPCNTRPEKGGLEEKATGG